MGIITRLLHRSDGLKPNRFNAFSFDTGENIHLHYRDLRIEFSVDEFLEFHDLCMLYLPQLKAEIESGYVDGILPNTNQNSTWKQFNNKKPLVHEIRYNPTRISLEENTDGYHLHIRNYKFLLDKESFFSLMNAASDSLKKEKSDISLTEVVELIGINELSCTVDKISSEPDNEMAVLTVENCFFKKTCQLLEALGFNCENKNNTLVTYRKSSASIHLKSNKSRVSGLRTSIFKLEKYITTYAKELSAEEVNLIKLQILDVLTRFRKEGKGSFSETSYRELLYDADSQKVIFPLRNNRDSSDTRLAFDEFNSFMRSVGLSNVKPAKIPYSLEEQKRLDDVFQNHVRNYIAVYPCVKKIYLFGGFPKKPSGQYFVPFVSFDWVKLGSDFDILIEIDENHVIPSGWEYKFFWKKAGSAYYHLGDVDFPIESAFIEKYPNIDFYQHMIEAYLFFPSKGDSEVKDAYLQEFKGVCIYEREASAGNAYERVSEFVSRNYGLVVNEVVSMAPPSFNEVYKLETDQGARVVKFMRRQDFTPSIPGYQGGHLEYEAELLSGLSESGNVLKPISGVDGQVLQALDDRYCMLFPYVKTGEAKLPTRVQIEQAAATLAAFHSDPVHAIYRNEIYRFDEAAKYLLDQFYSLLDRFKISDDIRLKINENVPLIAASIGKISDAESVAKVHCHGDVCPRNFFFISGGAILFDFQSAYFGPRLSDIAEGALEFSRIGDSIDEELLQYFIDEYARHSPLGEVEIKLLPEMLFVQSAFRLARLFRLEVLFCYKVSNSRVTAYSKYMFDHQPSVS